MARGFYGSRPTKDDSTDSGPTFVQTPNTAPSGLAGEPQSVSVTPTPQADTDATTARSTANQGGFFQSEAPTPAGTDHAATFYDQTDNTASTTSSPTNVTVVGPRGPQGERGETGPQGAPGDRGPAGRDGTDGEDGADGAPGRNGVDGRDGRDGDDGLPGAPGAPGIQGPPGPAGRNGNDGAAGAPGDAGRSVARTNVVTPGTTTTPTVFELIDEDGNTLPGRVSVQPGPQGPQGDSITGPRGNDGPAFSIRNTTTTDVAPTADAEVVPTPVAGTPGQYDLAISIPRGAQGLQGTPGDDGDRGPQGDDGAPFTVRNTSTTALPSTDSPTVTPTPVAGSPGQFDLTFGIPQGIQGPRGRDGDAGDDGASVTTLELVTAGDANNPSVYRFVNSNGDVLNGTLMANPGPQGPVGPAGNTTLGDLTDVVIVNPAIHQVLMPNGDGTWSNSNISINDLSEFMDTNFQNREVVIHNGTNFVSRRMTSADLDDFVGVAGGREQNDLLYWSGTEYLSRSLADFVAGLTNEERESLITALELGSESVGLQYDSLTGELSVTVGEVTSNDVIIQSGGQGTTARCITDPTAPQSNELRFDAANRLYQEYAGFVMEVNTTNEVADTPLVISGIGLDLAKGSLDLSNYPRGIEIGE